jgi:hypothetical protein
MRYSSGNLILIGFVLVLIGFILPVLMVMRIIQPTIFLSFVSYIASALGLFLGLIGAILYVRVHRR